MTLTPAARARLLIVDDIESNRYVTGTYLRRAGYEVVDASSGGEALAAVADGQIDLVLLDVNLPDMSGYEVCERIKETPGMVIPVLHLSATAIDTADRSEGLRRGADAYMVEPVDRQELLATVEALLRSATTQRITVDFARRLRRLNELTLSVHAAPTIRRLLEAVVVGAAEVSRSSALVVGFPESMAIATHGRGQLVMMPVSAQQVAAAQTPAGRTEVLSSFLPREQLDMPLREYELTPGLDPDSVLAVVIDPSREDSESTDLLIHQLVQAAATALKNLRNYQTKQAIALTLQRTLLPGVVPDIAGLEVAVRYEASAEYTDVGGDFYEVFVLDEFRTAIAIGDVAGHSLEAATAMAQLRTAIRAYALEGHGPAANLQRLNSLLLRFHPEMTATVCLLEFDRRSSTIEVANAGHLPPLLVSQTGPVYLPVGGTMLGVHGLLIEPARFGFDRDQVLVLVTDGLIERRDENIDVGLERLITASAPPIRRLDEFCDRLLREVGPHSGPYDDIAIVGIRRI